MLCDYILLPHSIKKNTYVTKREKCFQKTAWHVIEIQTLKSNLKEDDHRIIHHTHFASNQHNSVCIVADDRSILVLLLYISRMCCCQIYFREWTHSSKKRILYHNVSLLSQHLGPSVCDILPALQTLTGCDYTNQFHGRSKYGSFKIMQREKEMINKLSSLSTRNIAFDCVIEFILRVINNRPRTETTLGDSRYAMLFDMKKGKKIKFSDTNRLKPDKSSLKMKIKREYYVTQGILNFFLSLRIFHSN